MFRTFLKTLAVGALLCGAASAEEINAISLNNGAVLKSTSSEYGGASAVQWTALALIDESLQHGWSSKKNAPFNHEMVFELANNYQLSSFAFDNSDTSKYTHKNYAAKGVTISVSTQSARGPFTKVVEQDVDVNGRTVVPLSAPVQARWVKVEFTSNAGREGYTTMMELSALGTPTNVRNYATRFNGTYETNWGPFFLSVNGTEIRGCYDHDGGRFNGDLVAGVMNITWYEGKQVGTAALSLTEDGSSFSGFWNENGARRGTWIGNYTADASKTPKCSTGLLQPAKSSIAQSLDDYGSASLYGIYFDVASAVIKPQSARTLNSVLGWLRSNPAANVVFEGHTDATGDDAYNLNLSNQRASAVKTWLASNGIAASRLSSIGMGETQPVADNSTPRGRSLNRRVDIKVR